MKFPQFKLEVKELKIGRVIENDQKRSKIRKREKRG
jgi:hypothetical protein